MKKKLLRAMSVLILCLCFAIQMLTPIVAEAATHTYNGNTITESTITDRDTLSRSNDDELISTLRVNICNEPKMFVADKGSGFKYIELAKNGYGTNDLYKYKTYSSNPYYNMDYTYTDANGNKKDGSYYVFQFDEQEKTYLSSVSMKLKVVFPSAATVVQDGKKVNLDLILDYSDFWTSHKITTGDSVRNQNIRRLWFTTYGVPNNQSMSNEWFMWGFESYDLEVSFREHNSNFDVNAANADSAVTVNGKSRIIFPASYLTLYSEDFTDTVTSGGDTFHAECSAGFDSNGSATSKEYATDAYKMKNGFVASNMAYKASYKQGSWNYYHFYQPTAAHVGEIGRFTTNAISYKYKQTDKMFINMFILGRNYAMSTGYHLNFNTLVPLSPDKPVKSVDKSEATAGDTLKYTVTQSFPNAGGDTTWYLKSMVMNDILSSSIIYEPLSVTVQIRNSVTGRVLKSLVKDTDYTASLSAGLDNQKVLTVALKPDFLSAAANRSFYDGDTEVCITFDAKVNVGATGDRSGYVDNTATTILNGNTTLTSNRVSTRLYTNITTRHVYAGTDNLLNTVAGGESYTDAQCVQTVKRYLGQTYTSSHYSNLKAFKYTGSRSTNSNVLPIDSVFGGVNNVVVTSAHSSIIVRHEYQYGDATVTIRYVDMSGNKIANDVVKSYKFNDEYTTSAVTIAGYVLKETPSNANGTILAKETVVIYKYDRAAAKVVVQHVDDKGKKLVPDEVINGKVGDDYLTKSLLLTQPDEFSDYNLVSRTDNWKGQMTASQITVKFVYALKPTDVLVHYVDTNGNKLCDDVVINGKIGDNYSTDVKLFDNYELSTMPENSRGVMTKDCIEVTYVYTYILSGVVTRYFDTNGNVIAASVSLEGNVGANYQTKPKDIHGYKLTAVPSNASGKYGTDIIYVDYIYMLDSTSIIVRYVTEDSKPLCDDATVDGDYFAPYKTSAKDFKGYVLKAVPSNATGVMDDNIVVTYVYARKDTSVIVHYVDETGCGLSEDIVLNGKYGDAYNTEKKSFVDYEFKRVDGNASGTMTEDTIEVTYVYGLKNGKVVVSYVDDSGNKLSEDVVLRGKVHETYFTEQKPFENYHIKMVPNNASGTYIDGTITVEYVYELNDGEVIVSYVDEKGNRFCDDIYMTGKVTHSYVTEQKSFGDYDIKQVPDNAKGVYINGTLYVQYVYELKQTTVIVHYVDSHGNELAQTIEISGRVGDSYSTEQKEFDGYYFVSVDGDAYGTMTANTIEITYVYDTEVELPSAGVSTFIIYFAVLLILTIFYVSLAVVFVNKRKTANVE